MGNVPKFRFPEFSGEWVKHQLNEIMYESKARNTNNKFSKKQVLSVTREYGIVNQIEHLGRSFAGKSLTNYFVVQKGDVVYTKSPLRFNPYGIIKVNKGLTGIVSVLYAVYSVKTKHSAFFIDYYYELDDHTNKYLRPLVNKGAKNVLAINNTVFLTGHIYVPKLQEQSKIVKFLTAIETRIRMQEEMVQSIEYYKKGLLDKIFSQEIRFKDDNEKDYPSWGKRWLSEVLTESRVKNNLDYKVCSVAVKKGVVDQVKHMGRSYAAKRIEHYNCVNPGDIVYTKSPTGDFPYGIVKQSFLKEPVAVSPLYGVFKPITIELGYILHSYFNYKVSANNYLAPLAQKGAKNTINITNQRFLENKLSLPTSLHEQTKIANFLTLFDRKIDKEKEKLDALREQKKGLLQQMFV